MMGRMATIKTRPNDGNVDAFLESVRRPATPRRRRTLRVLMEQTTGATATMWGTSIVGFGTQPYTNSSGTNDWFVVGFSPRRAATTIYGVHDGYGPADPVLDQLGPHTTSKGCLYIKRLSDVDEDVLTGMIRTAWDRAHRSG